jgi:cation transport protein ChaC
MGREFARVHHRCISLLARPSRGGGGAISTPLSPECHLLARSTCNATIASAMKPLPPPLRDPAPLLQRLLADWGGRRDLWVFGYASLIWRPEFEAAEHRPARVHGWHRALRMRSRVNRGTPEQPGLVFALLPGGACRGVVYRLPRERAHAELERLWAREMPTGVYDPRFLRARTPQGEVGALAFTLSRRSEACLGHIPDEQMLHILRHARGRFGTTLDYLAETAHALRAHGVHDLEIERLMRLAERAGLLAPGSSSRAQA